MPPPSIFLFQDSALAKQRLAHDRIVTGKRHAPIFRTHSRGRAGEIMVAGARAEIVREREAVDELTRGERLPTW